MWLVTCLGQLPPLAVGTVTVPRHFREPAPEGTEGHKRIWKPDRQEEAWLPFHKRQVILNPNQCGTVLCEEIVFVALS